MRSEGLKWAQNKHVHEKYDDIRILPNGTKDIWKNAAVENGLPMQLSANVDCNPEKSEIKQCSVYSPHKRG